MKIKTRTVDLLHDLWERADYGFRWLCYGISPAGRLITVVTFFLLYGILAVYLTVTSIYSIGKRDAEKEFMKIQHIQQLELQKNDSINQLKQKIYEHKR